MRIIVVFITLLIVSSASSQEYKEHIDFTVQYFPSRQGAYEFYQLGFYHDRSERFAIGGSANVILGYSKIQDASFSNAFISFGTKWYLFPKRKFFVDPMLDIQYAAVELRPSGEIFRGFGKRAALNIGYEFNRFSIGLTGQSGFYVGKEAIIGGGDPPSGIPLSEGLTYRFYLLNTGVYFSYKF